MCICIPWISATIDMSIMLWNILIHPHLASKTKLLRNRPRPAMQTETVVPGKGGRAKFHDQKRMFGSESIYIYIYICTHICLYWNRIQHRIYFYWYTIQYTLWINYELHLARGSSVAAGSTGALRVWVSPKKGGHRGWLKLHDLKRCRQRWSESKCTLWLWLT